ncbi:uncharacterized protein LOC119685538 [Teleopsis dalmanni]|uniref:uncharacterized protein LOC119685538 n=1 Tax=Teleopsis dalmanni TaxID=139649 RepID=UPI0018CEC66B|nr:uncharacterized protein LOC119685538 [Teleopsis dalmanni]
MSEFGDVILNSGDVNQVIADLIGRFVMDLYHSCLISKESGWVIEKRIARSRFQSFIKNKENAAISETYKLQYTNLDFLLRKEKFLRYTPPRSLHYKISRNDLFDFRRKIIEKMDENRISGDNSGLNGNIFDMSLDSKEISGTKSDQGLDPALSAIQEVDPNSKHHVLNYEGKKKQTSIQNYHMTNMGCYICQENFSSHGEFEKHVQKHGDETDFEILETYEKFDNSNITLSYQLCKNSQFFLFTLKTSLKRITIEKIIIVQSKCFSYIKNASVPYEMPENGCDTFYVDSNIFRIYVEQPIMICYRYEGDIYIEQHHFLRYEEFPTPSIMLNPYRLTDKVTFKEIVLLGSYIPIVEVRTAMRSVNYLDSLRQNCPQFDEYINNNKTLNENNICQVLRTLLYMDDVDTLFEYLRYAQSKVPLKKRQMDFTLKLQLPQRIANSGQISPYDEVVVINEKDLKNYTTQDKIINLLMQTNFELRANNKMRIIHIGIINEVFNKRIKVSMRSPIPNDALYMVFIRPSRMPIRYQHRALDLLTSNGKLNKNFEDILFPTKIQITSTSHIKSIDFFNKNVSENLEQKDAVENIVNITHTNAPYIISGPPGTGKTTLLVEAILQLVLKTSDTKILITAGSNSACDEIASRLLKVISTVEQSHLLIRIYSKSNEDKRYELDDSLLDYSNMYKFHFYPDIASLHQFRIIICTLTIAGKLSTGGFGKNSKGNGVFTHVFIDEAATSTEPETLVGIVGIVTKTTRLILSGDHKQLRSVIKSQRAVDMGLSISLMERLLNRECYNNDENKKYNKSIQIQLKRNFRCHPQIVDLFSTMYYDKQLLAQPKTDVYFMCQKWHKSPNKEYPIIFHSVFGNCSRDNNSLSFLNTTESEVVIDYVKDLIYFGINGKSINEEDIGIISPYKKQYLYIKEELKKLCFQNIEMGSVEYFQGREKEIIIVSFVRSFTNDLGFLDNPNRINVTISRAKSLLILIGNPKTLEKSTDLKFIQERCIEHGTRVGAAVYDDTIVVKPHNKVKNNVKHPSNNKNQIRNSNPKNSIEALDTLLSTLPKVPTALKSKNTKSVTDTKQIENHLKNLGISAQNTLLKAASSSKSGTDMKTQVKSNTAKINPFLSHSNDKLLCDRNIEISNSMCEAKAFTSESYLQNSNSQRSLILDIGTSSSKTLKPEKSLSVRTTLNGNIISHDSKISNATMTKSAIPIQNNKLTTVHTSDRETSRSRSTHSPSTSYTTTTATTPTSRNSCATSTNGAAFVQDSSFLIQNKHVTTIPFSYSLSAASNNLKTTPTKYTTSTTVVQPSYSYDVNVTNRNIQSIQKETKKKTKTVFVHGIPPPEVI